ncbi:MAG: fluoride efflux transporter CrcB [Gammaproteobacteria bacterium]|nr:fluoride efflux transporter CrcB [Gammaproteobacteria bacterium]
MSLQIAAIASGGAIGALLRFWISNGVYSFMGRDFPYGTLVVNVVGSFAMGIGFIFLVERAALAPEWRAFLLVGLLGALTTFSTFSIETLNLIESGALTKAAINMVGSVLVCVVAVWAGVLLARQL